MPSSDQMIFCLVLGILGAEVFPNDGVGWEIGGKETVERSAS